MNHFDARVLVAGSASGQILHLEADLSFWGAIDPLTGRVIDRRHPQYEKVIDGKILLLRRSIGSSSGSAILLETLYRTCGPAGIVLSEPDQILTLGAVVAREMGYSSIPVVQLDSALFEEISGQASIFEDGKIETF
jgi:predicted aconitase with swiveling domain